MSLKISGSQVMGRNNLGQLDSRFFKFEYREKHLADFDNFLNGSHRNHRTYFGIFFLVSLDAENEDDCSSNCEHKSELENLNKLISLDDNKIPDNLWKIFPAKGQCIKNILIYSGYETFDSIVKLKDDSELTEPISFVKEMSP